jgi:hypothetical protein
MSKILEMLGLADKNWVILAREFIITLRSINEAYRLRHKLPKPTYLPEDDWAKLLEEPSEIEDTPEGP